MFFTSPSIRSRLTVSCLSLSVLYPCFSHSHSDGHIAQAVNKNSQTYGYQLDLGTKPIPAIRQLHVSESGSFTKFLSGFGGLGFFSNAINITSAVDLPEPTLISDVAEDNGSIPLAAALDLASGMAVVVESQLGDGPFADQPGKTDVDFYALRNLEQGQTLRINASRLEPVPDQLLPPEGVRGYDIDLYDASGQIIASEFSETSSALLNVSIPNDGNYFIGIKGRSGTLIDDVFDSTSVVFLDNSVFPFLPENPPRNQGAYTLEIGLDYNAIQTFKFFAKPGMVISGVVKAPGDAELLIVDPENVARIGNSSALPVKSSKAPFPNGNVEVAHVSDKLGIYEIHLLAGAPGDYELTLRADLPPLHKDQRSASTQVIYIDFEPATILENTFIESPGHPGAEVSGLSDMEIFGLAPENKDALIDQIIQTIEMQLVEHIRATGVDKAFDIDIRNSRDHENVWGEANVSRVILAGGSFETRGISPAAGFAQSIDIGNFDTEETAFVNLANVVMNYRAPNFGDIDPIAARVRFYGHAVATLISHEIGHILGNYHVFSPEDIMLGNIARVNSRRVSFGDDGIAGTDDDVLPTFGQSFIDTPTAYGIQDGVSNITFSSSGSRIRQTGSFSSSFSSKNNGGAVSVEYQSKENGEEVESFNYTSE